MDTVRPTQPKGAFKVSCITQTSQPFRFSISMGMLPEGFCGTPQELAQAIADRLIIQSDQNFSSFAIGPNAPTSNVGPWLKDCQTWYVWDDNAGQYVAMQFPSVQSLTFPPGAVTAWAGCISNIPIGWLFCDGSQVLISDYPNLYAAIGLGYGTPTCTGGFKLPDLLDKFIVGARQDDGSPCQAKTNITGSLTKTGGSTTHTHPYTLGCDGRGGTDGDLIHPFCGSYNTGAGGSVPPYVAMAYIIKT